MAHKVAAAYHAEAEVEFFSSVRPLLNDKALMQRFLTTAPTVAGTEHVLEIPPLNGSDDFAEYLAVKPGIYVGVGSMNVEKGIVRYHHHPLFDIDEDDFPLTAHLMPSTPMIF